MHHHSKQPDEPLMRDAKGRFVPVSKIPEVDLLRDSAVRAWCDAAKDRSKQLAQFKGEITRDMQAFLELSAEQYGAEVGGAKGNVTLLSFDGRFKVQRQVQDRLAFDERLQAAKSLIDTCIREWAGGAHANIQALIEHAFQVDKEGQVSIDRVLGLRRLKIEDDRWQLAMRAISDSIQVISSKTYIRFYEQDESGSYRAISCDLSSVEAAR